MFKHQIKRCFNCVEKEKKEVDSGAQCNWCKQRLDCLQVLPLWQQRLRDMCGWGGGGTTVISRLSYLSKTLYLCREILYSDRSVSINVYYYSLETVYVEVITWVLELLFLQPTIMGRVVYVDCSVTKSILKQCFTKLKLYHWPI